MSNSPVKALVERIRVVADLYPTREATAESAGVSNTQLNRYLTGRAKISLIVALRSAEPQVISMNRLATGDGAMYANVETPNQEQTIRLIRHVSNQVDNILAADIIRRHTCRPNESITKYLTGIQGRDANRTLAPT